MNSITILHSKFSMLENKMGNKCGKMSVSAAVVHRNILDMEKKKQLTQTANEQKDREIKVTEWQIGRNQVLNEKKIKT